MIDPENPGAPSQSASSIEVGSTAAWALDLCARIAAHTDVPGTITRTFLSPATESVHALLREEMIALGMTVRTDAIGNLRGIYPAQQTLSSFAEGGGPASVFPPTLLLGSHIDTVPDAGPFDGILGVALSLALLRSLHAESRHFPYAIELIAFSEEEGIRFKLPFVGSRALIGDLSAADLAREDADGISVAQAIRTFDPNPTGAPSQTASPFEVGCALLTPHTFAFLEVHIEQGPVLESLDLPFGVVTTIVGQSRFELTFTGEANHAGTTPMPLRHDALAAAAAFILAAETLARDTPGLVATVGSIAAQPGAPNIIPGSVTCSIDIRHSDDSIRTTAAAQLISAAGHSAAARGVRCQHRQTSAQPSVPMDPALRELLAAAAPGAHPMPSGAGHDAMILAPHIPSAMLFVRSPRGLSHHPEESVLPRDIEAALVACLNFLEALPAPPCA